MIDLTTADELEQLAVRIARIRPMSNANPHAFYEERSEVASELRAVAARLRGAPAKAVDTARSVAPIGGRIRKQETRHCNGRTLVVLTRGETAGVR